MSDPTPEERLLFAREMVAELRAKIGDAKLAAERKGPQIAEKRLKAAIRAFVAANEAAHEAARSVGRPGSPEYDRAYQRAWAR